MDGFFVEKLVKRKLRRMKIGRYGELTTEQARKQAQILLGKIAQGIGPLAEERANKMRQVTLKEAMADYLKARKSLKAKTLYDYQRVLNIAFDNWKNKPLVSITKDKVTKHHEKLGKKRGQAHANLAMRVLRALFNLAASQYEDAEGKSLINIYKSGEVSKKGTVAKFATVQKEGEREVSRNVEHFSLDIILSVGYRINSKKATHFRQWATKTLKEHIQKGFTINPHHIQTNHKGGS